MENIRMGIDPERIRKGKNGRYHYISDRKFL